MQLARRYARDAFRPVRAGPSTAAVRASVEGEIVVLSADAGELDGDWSDPAVVQRALFTVVEGLRRSQPALDPHFIVVLSTFFVESPAALYLPLANDVRGIGYRHLEPAEVFRFTPGRLDGVLFMNGVQVADAPLAEALFLQELGHRWGVYVRLPDPDGTRLLGRDCAHWSAFARTAGSAMEGNPWVERAPGRFFADVPPAVGYGDADRYLMGLVPAAAVAPVARVSEAGWPCFAAQRMGVANPRAAAPTWRTGEAVEVDGRLESTAWAEVVAHEGPRDPSHAEARRRWSAVFVLAARAADDPAAALPIVEGARRRWSAAFARATATDASDGLILETTLDAARLANPPGSVGLGGRCLDALDCAPSAPRCVATASGDHICTAACAAHAECAPGGCCVALTVGDAVCAPSADPCPAVDDPDAAIGDAGPADGSLLDGAPTDGESPDAGDAAPSDGLPADGGPTRRAPSSCAHTPVGVMPRPPGAPGWLMLGWLLLGWRVRRGIRGGRR